MLRTVGDVENPGPSAGSVWIRDNPSLASVSGFDLLAEVSGSLAVDGNPSAETITGFSSLERVGDDLVVDAPLADATGAFSSLAAAGVAGAVTVSLLPHNHTCGAPALLYGDRCEEFCVDGVICGGGTCLDPVIGGGGLCDCAQATDTCPPDSGTADEGGADMSPPSNDTDASSGPTGSGGGGEDGGDPSNTESEPSDGSSSSSGLSGAAAVRRRPDLASRML